MTKRTIYLLGLVTSLLSLVSERAAAQLMPLCIADSPERRGDVGCSVVVQKELPVGLKEPLFWHIDRFDSLERARKAEGPTSVAFEAAGKAWLMTVEPRTSDHHGGEHVAAVGPLLLPEASRYAMQVNSARFLPGMYSRVHHHSGVEGFYVLEGEQCLQTPTGATRLKKGETAALPAGIPMRVLVTGTTMRHGFGIIIHDAEQPSTMQMEEGDAPPLVACQ